MSYGGVENTKEELAILVGATITGFKIVPDAMDEQALEMEVKFARPIHTQDGGPYATGTFQIWMDEEGNGPGYIALTGAKP